MTVSKMAKAWTALLPLRDGVDREEIARSLDDMFNRVRRETVDLCMTWLRSEYEPDAGGWEADALRAADELSYVKAMIDAIAEVDGLAPRPAEAAPPVLSTRQLTEYAEARELADRTGESVRLVNEDGSLRAIIHPLPAQAEEDEWTTNDDHNAHEVERAEKRSNEASTPQDGWTVQNGHELDGSGFVGFWASGPVRGSWSEAEADVPRSANPLREPLSSLARAAERVANLQPATIAKDKAEFERFAVFYAAIHDAQEALRAVAKTSGVATPPLGGAATECSPGSEETKEGRR